MLIFNVIFFTCHIHLFHNNKKNLYYKVDKTDSCNKKNVEITVKETLIFTGKKILPKNLFPAYVFKLGKFSYKNNFFHKYKLINSNICWIVESIFLIFQTIELLFIQFHIQSFLCLKWLSLLPCPFFLFTVLSFLFPLSCFICECIAIAYLLDNVLIYVKRNKDIIDIKTTIWLKQFEICVEVNYGICHKLLKYPEN